MKNLKSRLAIHLLSALCLLTGAYGQITPSGDAYTNTATPTTNYGAKTLLDVESASQTTYIQFDLSSLPSGYTSANITKATLKLYVNAVTTAGNLNVDFVNGTWSEKTITANNAPALGTTIAASVPLTTANKNDYIIVDVTSAVGAWLNGTEVNDGIALVGNSPLNASFDSKENTTTSHSAELDIVFAGGGTITGVTTASGSGLTGGGTSGTLNLSLTNSCATSQVLQWNGSSWICAAVGTGTITGVTAGTDLTGGGASGNVTLNLDTTKIPQLAANNNFSGNQSVAGNLSATGSIGGSTGNFSGSNSTYVLQVAQSGAGVGINAINTGSTLPAIYASQGNSSNSSAAIYGTSPSSTGVGVEGFNTASTGGTAMAAATNSTSGVALFADAGASSGTSVAIKGQANSVNGVGLSVVNTAGGLAGQFGGTVSVTGGDVAVNSGDIDLPGTTNSTTGVINQGGTYFIHTCCGNSGNVFVGNLAGNFGTTGTFNTAAGTWSLNANTTGTGNTTSGYKSLLFNTTGGFNTATGLTALLNNTTGSSNTAVGDIALSSNTTGSDNVAVGTVAGGASPNGAVTTGNLDTYVGAFTSSGTQLNLTNASAIGAYAEVTANNSLVLGSINGVNSATADTNVGIGTTAPTNPLTVTTASTYIPVAISSSSGFGTWMTLGNTSSGGHIWNILSAASGNAEGAGNLGITDLTGTSTIYLEGNVNVTGNLSKASGSFQIDHPLDPANKYLYHSFVESPDMMNVYNGNTTTDRYGLATVVLPDYFEALNRDFRYQLTVIGQFAQAIVAKEISRGRFTIRTSKAGVKVSWQVTGIRQDAYANAHRIPVEVEKPAREQGRYLHPELFGASDEQAIGVRVPESGTIAAAPSVKTSWLTAEKH